MGKRKSEAAHAAAEKPSQLTPSDAAASSKKKKRKTLDGAQPSARSSHPLPPYPIDDFTRATWNTLKRAQPPEPPLKALEDAAAKLQSGSKQKKLKTTQFGRWLLQARQDYVRAWTANKALTWRQFLQGYRPPVERPAGGTMTVRELLALPASRLSKLSVEAVKQLPHPVFLAVRKKLQDAGFFTPKAAAEFGIPMYRLQEVPVSVPVDLDKKQTTQQQQQAARKVPTLVSLPTGRSVLSDAWRYQVTRKKAVDGGPPVVKVEVKLDESTTVRGSTAQLPLHEAAPASYAVGLYDWQQQRLRLMPLQSERAIRLEPRVKGVQYVPKAATAEEIAAREAAAADLQHQRQRAVKLVQEFGSTRRQRTQRQKEEATVRAHKLNDQGQLSALMQNVQDKAEEQGQTQQGLLARMQGYRNIPPHHPEATLADDAYVLSEVFPGVWGAVNSGQLLGASEDAAALAALKERQQVVPYVLGRISQLQNTPEQQQATRKQRAKALTLLNVVLRLLGCGLRVRAPRRADDEEGDAAAGAGFVGGPAAGIARKLRIARQQAVLEGLLDQFYHPMSDGQGWEIDPAKLELLLLSGLVLALAVEGWSLSSGQFDALRTDLKKTPQELASKFRELGCTCRAIKAPAGTPGSSSGAAGSSSYAVVLQLSETRALGDALPKPKLLSKGRGAR